MSHDKIFEDPTLSRATVVHIFSFHERKTRNITTNQLTN